MTLVGQYVVRRYACSVNVINATRTNKQPYDMAMNVVLCGGISCTNQVDAVLTYFLVKSTIVVAARKGHFAIRGKRWVTPKKGNQPNSSHFECKHDGQLFPCNMQNTKTNMIG